MVGREERLVPDSDERERRERRFSMLYQEHYRAVQDYAVRRLESPADVADAVAEVFTIAWRRLGVVPAPPQDRLWLYGVARRVIAGRYRAARRFRQLTVRLAASDVTVGRQPGMGEDDPDRERLLAALRCLRAGDREALALVLWEGLPHAEAAQVLGCSVNAVAIRVHRAKARLRTELMSTGPPGLAARAGAAAARVPAAGRVPAAARVPTAGRVPAAAESNRS